MDNYISNDPNNPINYEPQTNYCEVCNIEEYKTYFVDETQICENCYTEEEETNE